MSAEVLAAITERVERVGHQCDVYDAAAMEWYRRPELCLRCDFDSILDMEPQ
jgi:hypothetical protein